MSQFELIEAQKKFNGHNLPIDRSVNNISKECEDLLKRVLTSDTNQRISWKEFFDHPLFREDKPQNVMNSVLIGLNGHNQNKVMVSNMWQQAKMDHKDTDDNNTLLPTDKLDNMQADMQQFDEQENVDTVMTDNLRAENERLNKYENNRHRYEHEMNKIRFIFSAAQKMMELQQAIGFGHPLASSMALIFLCHGKKGRTFMHFNCQSLRDKMNIFKLECFDEWLQSDNGQELVNTVEGNDKSYQQYWDYLANAINQFQWSPEDQNKVIPQLLGNMDLNFLHNVVNYKIREVMKLRGDYNLMQNQYYRSLLYKALIYADCTQKCEDPNMFPFHQGVFFNWTKFKNDIENAPVHV